MKLFFKNIIVLIILVVFSSLLAASWDYFHFPLEEFISSIFLPSLALIIIYFTNRKKVKRLFPVFYFFLMYLILYYLVICLFYSLRWFSIGGLWNLIGEIFYLSFFVVIHLLFLCLRSIFTR